MPKHLSVDTINDDHFKIVSNNLHLQDSRFIEVSNNSEATLTGTTATIVPFDNTLSSKDPSPSIFSLNNNQVVIDSEASTRHYTIDVCVNMANATISRDPKEGSVWIEVNSTEVAGSRRYVYLAPDSDASQGSAIIHKVVELAADDYVEVWGERVSAAGDNIKFLIDCTLTIKEWGV